MIQIWFAWKRGNWSKQQTRKKQLQNQKREKHWPPPPPRPTFVRSDSPRPSNVKRARITLSKNMARRSLVFSEPVENLIWNPNAVHKINTQKEAEIHYMCKGSYLPVCDDDMSCKLYCLCYFVYRKLVNFLILYFSCC